jgi:hypothetical protein
LNYQDYHLKKIFLKPKNCPGVLGKEPGLTIALNQPTDQKNDRHLAFLLDIIGKN